MLFYVRRAIVKTNCMEQNLAQLSIDELHDLFRVETSHFLKSVEKNMPFDELKKIRVLLRAIEAEIKKRK